MKRLTILGSTGSIGLNALELIERNPEKYRAIALTAGRNVDLLAKQIEKFRSSGPDLIEKLPQRSFMEQKDSYTWPPWKKWIRWSLP
jgi:1-deoxy-D-xylulose-5-phosphate reductoisomerase